MEKPISNEKYEYTYVFFGRKVIKHGDHYAVYIPKKLATYILATYGGYVDIEVKVPTMFPRMPKEQKKA